MLKQLFAGLFALTFAIANFPSFVPTTANATGATTITNIRSLCEIIIANGENFNRSKTCDEYSYDQTSATITFPIYFHGDLILKDLDLTFTIANVPFVLRSGDSGSLTIDGGTYSSPSCVVWIQYNNMYEPGYYVPSTSIIINSGTFEAFGDTEAPSPVCLITHTTVTPEKAQAIIAGYLPTGKKFIDVAPKLRTARTVATGSDAIDAESGFVHIQKDYSNRDEVKYLKTTRVAVVGEPEPEPEPEPTPEPTSEPEPTPEPTPETPKETPKTPETQPAADETPKTPVIPKAPNTGVK